MSSVQQKKRNGKGYGSFHYVRDNKWTSLKTSSRKLAELKKGKLDKEFWLEEEMGVKRKIHWREFFPEYLKEYVTDAAPGSVVGLRNAVGWFERLVAPDVLSDVLPETLAQFKADLLSAEYTAGNRKGQKRLQASTINTILAYIAPIFVKAHARGKIAINPCYGINPVPELEKSAAWLEREDLDRLLVEANRRVPLSKPVAPDKDAAADVVLAMLIEQDTGMRLGEILHQRIQDVSFEEGFLYIKNHSDGRRDPPCDCFACRTAKAPGWHTKNRRQRFIPLTPRLHLALQEVRKEKSAGCILEWSRSAISSGIKRCYRQLGLSGRNHAFRHSLKTEMRRAGVNETVIGRILGHGKRTIGDHYDHTTKAEMTGEFKKLLAFREEWQKKAMEGKLNVI